MKKRIVIGITGASGVIYGLRLLEILHNNPNVETHLIISHSAFNIIDHEMDITIDEINNMANHIHDVEDIAAIINSGSYYFDATVIIPCSMKTLSSIANGYSDNSITRVADVTLKERRTLIIVPRETPLRTRHLMNMTTISQEGGIILPAMPGFYHNPETISDQIDFIVGKILDILKIENNLFKKWKQ